MSFFEGAAAAFATAAAAAQAPGWQTSQEFVPHPSNSWLLGLV